MAMAPAGYFVFPPCHQYHRPPPELRFNLNGRNAATDAMTATAARCLGNFLFRASASYNGSSDPDGDGVNNYEEYLEGTTPTTAQLLIPGSSSTPEMASYPQSVGTATITPPKVWYAPNTPCDHPRRPIRATAS